jgi:exodeoxyribonuclease V beta subunit
MDRLKKAPPARDAIIYEYDNIALQSLYLRQKPRDLLDSTYANALAKEKILAREDTLNALYVAFTRARENLFVISKTKDSLFDILDLEVLKRGELHCRQGESNASTNMQKKTLEYMPLYYGTQSDILALEESKEEDLKAINFGLAMHYMLEMLANFTPNAIQNAKDMMINKYGYFLDSREVADILNRVTLLLNNSEFLKLSAGESYKEKAIRYKNNLRYIDLLVKNDESSWSVIDYKSSMAYSSHHHKQVRFYINAIKEITGERVDGYICYLLENEIKIVKI